MKKLSKIVKTPDKEPNPRLKPFKRTFISTPNGTEYELTQVMDEFIPPTFEEIYQIRLDSDGTYYDLIMIFIPDGIYCGSMCQNGACWLIINNINRTAYSFRNEGWIAQDYLQEKIGKGLSDKDMQNIKQAIEWVIAKHKRRMKN